MVGRPSLRSGSGRETLPEVRKWSGHPPVDLEMDVRPSQRSECGRRASWRCGPGRETLLEVQKWPRDPPGDVELVG